MSARGAAAALGLLLAACAPRVSAQTPGRDDPRSVELTDAARQAAELSAAAVKESRRRCDELLAKPVLLEEERRLGAALSTAFIAKSGGLLLDLPGDAGPPARTKVNELTRYVNRVGKLLAARSSRPTLPWTFGVLKDDAPRALSAPGGYVFLTAGALRQLDSEAMLAGVLAHQIGHVVEKHELEVLRKVKAAKCSAEVLMNSNGPFARLGTGRGDVDEEMVNSLTGKVMHDLAAGVAVQADELAADRIAQELLLLAGYDPAPYRDHLDAVPELLAAPAPPAAVRREKLLEQLEGFRDPSSFSRVDLDSAPLRTPKLGDQLAPARDAGR